MNCLLTNSFTTFFVNLFSNWQLVLFIVLTILLLLMIFFKRFKLLFWFLVSGAVIIGLVLLVMLIIDAVQWDLFGFIDFAIAWGPTILFSLIVVLSTLVNAKRGRRKSLILFAQSTAAAVVWVLVYYFGAKSEKIDTALVKLVNHFMGENGLQNTLHVSVEATSFKNIFSLYLIGKGGNGTLGILLNDTSAYVYTLVDMVYHIGFAVLCYIFYLFTVFLLYLIYLCFYSERKFKCKKETALSENQTDSRYKKHRTAGGFVGLVRGIVVGLMCMSFLGAGFYMIAGGRGEGKIRDYEVGGRYETPLRIYRSIESYGMQGIFMILNAMSDPNDIPYYLLAADLVFSGSLNDEQNDISQEVYLTKELGALSGLARDTIELLLKYGSDEIKGAVNGTSGTGLMSNVLSVMKNREFQEEFDLLIAQFESPKYVYNLMMSLVSSVLANIDSMSFGSSLSDKNKELVKIIFKEGYLSPYIPEDRQLHDLNEKMQAEDPWLTSGRNVRPYLGLQQLVTKDDLRVFINVFLTALTEKGEGADTFNLIRAILPKVKELSLFESGKADTIDPVFGRVYCFMQNAYLKAEGDETGYSYNAIANENIKWTDEIISLLDVTEDFFVVYDDVKDAESAVFNRILYIFDQDNPNRAKDIALFDKIEQKLSSSRIMGKTLATSFFRKTITDGLGQIFNGIYISRNTVYETTFTEDGSVLKHGELHYFLKGLRHLGCMDNQSLFELLFGDEEDEISSVLKTIADAMEQRDTDGNNFAYYVARSDLFRSVISCFLMEGGEGVIYVPSASLEKNEKGEQINLIQGDELEVVLNSMRLFSDFVSDCVNTEGGYYKYIDAYLDKSEFMHLIETNGIIEGSLARLVKEKFEGEENSGNVIIPKYLSEDVESWCSGTGGAVGELRKFIGAYLLLRNQAKSDQEAETGEATGEYTLNLKSLINGQDKDLLLTTASNLADKSEQFLSSDTIYYTVSNYLSRYSVNNLTVVVPVSARNTLYNDVLSSVIKRSELISVFSKLNLLGLDNNDGNKDDLSGQGLLKKLIEGKEAIEGEVMSASVVANMVSNGSFNSTLSLKYIYIDAAKKETYDSVGQKDYLEKGHFNLNPWSKELPKLLNALTVLFQDQVDNDNFGFNEDTLKNALLSIQNNPQALEVCLASDIISARIAQLIPSFGGNPGGGDQKEEDEADNEKDNGEDGGGDNVENPAEEEEDTNEEQEENSGNQPKE